MTEQLTEHQQMLAQRLLASHCMSEKRIKALWHSWEDSSLPDALHEINTQLVHCGLERYYAIVNTFPDEITTKGFEKSLNPSEHAFLKLVLIKLTEGPFAQSTLINLRNDMPEKCKATLSSAEDTLQMMIQENWFIQAGRGHKALVQLGPRAYMELSHLLTEEMGMEKEDLPQLIYHK
jgi:hypothetical protein